MADVLSYPSTMGKQFGSRSKNQKSLLFLNDIWYAYELQSAGDRF